MEFTLGLAFLSISVLYSFSLIVLFFGKKHVSNDETDIFGKLVITNFIGIIIESLCIILTQVYGIDSLISILVNKFFLIYLLIFQFIFSTYVFTINSENENSLNVRLVRLFYVFVRVMCIISSFLVFLFETNVFFENGVMYSYGMSVNIVYLTSAFFTFVCLVFLIANYKLIGKKKSFLLIFYIVGNGIITIIQKMNPAITLATSAETMLMFLMFHTI